MAIKRKRRFHAGVETSSMSDIMFFLLLFFLIISTLANPNVIKIPLPESKPTDQTNKQHLTLSITKEKQFFLDKEQVEFDQLGPKLKQLTTERMDQTVVVRPAKDVEVQVLIDVLQVGLANQLKFVIATQPG
ncbi:MAG: ExbD/TolR family protein [Fluviicola sp.]|jgi:biopolymer transport protein ExbD